MSGVGGAHIPHLTMTHCRYTFAPQMRKLAPIVITLLLGIFTFNQVILPHVMSMKDKVVMCDPLENDAEETSAPLELKFKEAQAFKAASALVPEHLLAEYRSVVADGLPKGTPPHGNHVPTYLDERVLRI